MEATARCWALIMSLQHETVYDIPGGAKACRGYLFLGGRVVVSSVTVNY